jgi:hypothetical protein
MRIEALQAECESLHISSNEKKQEESKDPEIKLQRA